MGRDPLNPGVSGLNSKIAKCDCQMYEFMGIVVQIPYHFILKRWPKEANKGIEASYIENNFDAEFTTSKIVRRMHAQQQTSILVDLAEESKEMYKFII
ncbi:hypothetical protein Lal_00006835 [Lupinus albus]|nr:hypothetical protein Lal_00006835 [Lupinus albus]